MKPGCDGTNPTFLDSLTCLLSQGHILGYTSSILLEKTNSPPIADLALGNPIFYFVVFLLIPLDLMLISWFGLIINILRYLAIQIILA